MYLNTYVYQKMTDNLTSKQYLDAAATTRVLPEVADLVQLYMLEEYGNAGSRSHTWGGSAQKAIGKARQQVSSVVQCDPDELIFTSGATESNNIAILGLEQHGVEANCKHIVTTQIEHKAVLEPIELLESRGFEVTRIKPMTSGVVNASDVSAAVRDDTLLVSVMHVNNETGVIQPIDEIADGLVNSETYFHTDAAQGFGKDIQRLCHPRIDMISISGHKIHAPKGVGALALRDRKYKRPPVQPLMVGGGQERGLRPGTQPVHLIAGIGLAAEIMCGSNESWHSKCIQFKESLLAELSELNPIIHGDVEQSLPNILNISFPGINSEAAMLLWQDHIGISNGAACTSSSYTLSHVLTAMGVTKPELAGALRFSWDSNQEPIILKDIASKIHSLAK